MAARSEAWVCGRSLAGIVVSNPTVDIDVCCECICCQVEVCASGRSLVQRSPTDCGVSSECDHEAPKGGHDPELGRSASGGGEFKILQINYRCISSP